jgi:hypothetical protein
MTEVREDGPLVHGDAYCREEAAVMVLRERLWLIVKPRNFEETGWALT